MNKNTKKALLISAMAIAVFSTVIAVKMYTPDMTEDRQIIEEGAPFEEPLVIAPEEEGKEGETPVENTTPEEMMEEENEKDPVAEVTQPADTENADAVPVAPKEEENGEKVEEEAKPVVSAPKVEAPEPVVTAPKEDAAKPVVAAPKPAPTPTPVAKSPVITSKTETKTVSISFQTVRQNDATLESGKTAVAQTGVNGTETVTYKVTYTDGRETARVETGRRTTRNPVNEIIKVGTKAVAVAPKPVVTTKEEVATEAVAYTTTEKEDPNTAAGTRTVTTAGKNGVRTIVYTVTLTDGKETGRAVKSNTVTTAPVNEVVSVGTKKTSPFDAYVKGILPAGYVMSSDHPDILPGGEGLFKNGVLAADFSVGVIIVYHTRIPQSEQRELVRFFGRFRQNLGRGNDTDKMLHLFDAWKDESVSDKPSYPGVYYDAQERFFRISVN